VKDPSLAQRLAAEKANPEPPPNSPDADLTAAAPTYLAPRWIRSVLIFVVGGIVLYGLAALPSNPKAIVSAVLGFPTRDLVLALALVLAGWALRGWRFYYYLRISAQPAPLGYCLKVFLASFALTGTPGKMGEGIKAVFLKQDYGVPVTQTLGILVVERLIDLLGVLLLGSLSILAFSQWKSVFALCAAIVVAGGAFLCMESLYRPALSRIIQARVRLLSWAAEKALNVLLTSRGLMNLRALVVGLIVSTVAWGAESVCMYLILDGLRLPSTLLQANFVYCFSTLVGALSMLPGGMGGAEAGMIGLLGFIGISYSEGLPAVIIIRLCTLWFAVIVGAAFLFALPARYLPGPRR
jgi:uncharacterized protein (TIRG00374 family)